MWRRIICMKSPVFCFVSCIWCFINKHPDIMERIWFAAVNVISVENTGSLQSSFCVPVNFLVCQCVPVITVCINQLSGCSFRTTGKFQTCFVEPVFLENWILLELYKSMPFSITSHCSVLPIYVFSVLSFPSVSFSV